MAAAIGLLIDIRHNGRGPVKMTTLTAFVQNHQNGMELVDQGKSREGTTDLIGSLGTTVANVKSNDEMDERESGPRNKRRKKKSKKYYQSSSFLIFIVT